MQTHIFDGYTMTLKDTGEREKEFGKAIVEYTFSKPDGTLLFSGKDLYASPMHDPESYEMAQSLLTFLTCSPGDVDEEYFDKYTTAQMDFVNSLDCEMLQIFTSE